MNRIYISPESKILKTEWMAAVAMLSAASAADEQNHNLINLIVLFG